MATEASASITNRLASGLEPNLVLFYNFNDPLTTAGEIANLGTAGADYDLVLGKLPKPAGSEVFGLRYDNANTIVDLSSPTVTASTDPSAWSPRSKPYDTSAPLVLWTTAGSTISGNAYSIAYSYSAPSPFTTTQVVATTDTSGAAATLHVLQQVAPSVSTTTTTRTGLEDASISYQLHGSSPLGLEMTAVVSRLPAKGSLFEVPTGDSTVRDSPITAVGQVVLSRRPAAAPVARYAPSTSVELAAASATMRLAF